MKFKILCLSLIIFNFVKGKSINYDEVLDNSEVPNLYKANNYSYSNALELLDQNISVNRKFNNIKDLISLINNMDGVRVILKNTSKIISNKAIYINEETTLKNLLNNLTARFGYKWIYKNGILYFLAFDPVIEDKSSIENRSILKEKWILDPKDSMLKNVFTNWCKRKGWQLVWNAQADYPITTHWEIEGTFEYAINEVLKATQSNDIALTGIMYDSNKVLEIKINN